MDIPGTQVFFYCGVDSITIYGTSTAVTTSVSSAGSIIMPELKPPAAAMNVAQYLVDRGYALPGQGIAGPWHNDDLMERL